jgi:hydroxypyruvate reductase
MDTRTQAVAAPQLRYTHGKELARRIFLDTMSAIDVRNAMLSKVECKVGVLRAGDVTVALSRPPYVVAFGKAAKRMAAALDEILSGHVERGIVVAPDHPRYPLDRFRYFTGGHPYPTLGTLQAAEAALQMVSNLSRDDTVVFLVSGGGSALFEKPLHPAVTLADLIEFNRVLVTCGLPIEQINVLRKHVSAVKGGRMAVAAYPARQLTIFISDVPPAFDSMVASGPTMPDDSTVEQCYTLAREYNLLERLPASIRKQFKEGALEETPKPGDPNFQNSTYFCLLSNRDAMMAARTAAERHGFIAEVDSGNWDADYRQVVRSKLAALDVLAARHPGEPVCLIAGGEVICPVTGSGTGGRNQAFVLDAAQEIAGQHRVILGAGTDGRDGNSPVSGAVADGVTLSRGRDLELHAADYLARSDSYSYFSALGDTVDTGPTDNNVRDVRLLLDFNA